VAIAVAVTVLRPAPQPAEEPEFAEAEPAYSEAA
jgi:hypothetical protein